MVMSCGCIVQLVLYQLRGELMTDYDMRIHEGLDRVVDGGPADMEMIVVKLFVQHLDIEVPLNPADMIQNHETLRCFPHPFLNQIA